MLQPCDHHRHDCPFPSGPPRRPMSPPRLGLWAAFPLLHAGLERALPLKLRQHAIHGISWLGHVQRAVPVDGRGAQQYESHLRLHCVRLPVSARRGAVYQEDDGVKVGFCS